MQDFQFKDKYDAYDLVKIMQLLRAPGGCPWDAEQTHQSIKKNLIEETYEVIEAINKDDKALMCEELGDLLFSAVNVARLLGVDSEYALTRSCDKFIRRFAETERLAIAEGIDLKTADTDTKDRLWKEAKEIVHSR